MIILITLCEQSVSYGRIFDIGSSAIFQREGDPEVRAAATCLPVPSVPVDPALSSPPSPASASCPLPSALCPGRLTGRHFRGFPGSVFLGALNPQEDEAGRARGQRSLPDFSREVPWRWRGCSAPRSQKLSLPWSRGPREAWCTQSPGLGDL